MCVNKEMKFNERHKALQPNEAEMSSVGIENLKSLGLCCADESLVDILRGSRERGSGASSGRSGNSVALLNGH